MTKVTFVCAVIALTLASAALAQPASTRFISFVDTPAVVTFNQWGQGMVPLDPQTGSVISTTGYRKVCIRIGTTSAASIMINMGKISGATLSQMITRPMSQKIQTYDVVGPEMVLFLTGGHPNTTEKVQLWVYLSS
ncbi:MAG: hypothetical protein ABSB78_14350 [Bacteroidota bacterium]